MAEDFQKVVEFGETALLQARKNPFFVEKHGEFAFLLSGHGFDLDILHLLLQFSSETRCAGLMPSGSTVYNRHLHLNSPLLRGFCLVTIQHTRLLPSSGVAVLLKCSHSRCMLRFCAARALLETKIRAC